MRFEGSLWAGASLCAGGSKGAWGGSENDAANRLGLMIVSTRGPNKRRAAWQPSA